MEDARIFGKYVNSITNSLKKKILNNFRFNNNSIYSFNNLNSIKSNNKNNKNNYYINNLSIKSISDTKNNNKVNINKLLKNINTGEKKKRTYSSINIINNKASNIFDVKNIKSFAGINYQNNTVEDKKINEFKDLLDKIIKDL